MSKHGQSDEIPEWVVQSQELIQLAAASYEKHFTDPLAAAREDRLGELIKACRAFDRSWRDSGGVGGNVVALIRSALDGVKGAEGERG